jgi:hypothetical protein
MLPAQIGFVNALVRYAEQLDDITPLTDLRDSLWTRIVNGEGKALVNASSNGKSFGYWLTMSVEDQFKFVVRAIDIYNETAGSSPITFLDFSQIDGWSQANPNC